MDLSSISLLASCLFFSLAFEKVGSKSRDGLCTTTIDDRINVINGDSGLCNVRAQNHLSDLQNVKVKAAIVGVLQLFQDFKT